MPLDRAIKVFLDAAAANGRPPISQVSPAEGRDGYVTYMSLAGTGPAMGSVEDRDLDGVPVRIYRPHGVAATGAPVLVWLHGGGWMIGSIETDDCRLRTMAEKAGVVVISVGYRLAPEHPFPAAFDDCLAVVSAVSAKADELGVDATRLAVGGDSAGGNLSAAVALWARDHNGPPIAFQLLIYPAVDTPEANYPSRDENASGYFLTKESMQYFWASYVTEADRVASRSDVRAMPMAAASLAGLPPAHVLTAEFDPLRDEGAAYAARLVADGVPTTYTNYDGCVHGFFGMQALFPVAGAAMEEAATALRTALTAASTPTDMRGHGAAVAGREAQRNSSASDSEAQRNSSASDSAASSALGRLAGKIAFITGGARGQGASEAGLFCREGATVVIGDVLDADGEATAAALRADGFACTYLHHDVTSEAGWAAVVASIVETYGRLDVLVNNAGIFPRGGVLDTSLADWEKVVAINQTGVFLGMQAAARVMVTQRSGSIVNISSIAGLEGTPGFLGYGATKWAVRGMTKAAAKELAAHGVRVNSVHPGIIETAMLETFDAISPGTRDVVKMRIPMGRTAEAVEVAQLVLYLASDESSYSTGSEFVVDGGWMA